MIHNILRNNTASRHIAQSRWMMHKSNTKSPAMRAQAPAILHALTLIFTLLATLSAPQTHAATLDENTIRQAYETLDTWLHAEGPPADAQPILVEGAAAVHVTLRFEGQTIGQATAHVQRPLDPSLIATTIQPAAATDITPLLRQALIQAIRLAAVNEPIATNQRPEDIIADLQVAGPPRPIVLQSLAQLPDQLIIDHHGLAASFGDAWTFQFPANSIAANLRLDNQINRLLSALELPLDRQPLIGKPDGIPLYRFDAVHIVRTSPGGPAIRMNRGNVLLSPRPINPNRIDSLIQTLADHLLQRQLPDGLFTGTYEPTPGEYKPQIAGLTDIAHATWALGRISKLTAINPQTSQRASIAATLTGETLIRLLDDDRLNNPAESLLAGRLSPTALTLLVILETPNLPEHRNIRLRLIGALKSMRRPNGSFLAQDGIPGRFATVSQQALASLALTAIYDLTREPNDLTAAHKAIEHLHTMLNDSNIHQALPWLAYAESDLARLGQPTPTFSQLPALFDSIWAAQQQPWNDPAETNRPNNALPYTADTIGGFRFPGRLIDEPDWQTAETLNATSIIIAHPNLLPAADVPSWVLNSTLAARYIDQLSMPSTSCWYVRSPANAIGGVRVSLWDNRQPLLATSASLLAIAELRQALSKFE